MFLANKIGGSRDGEGKWPFGYDRDYHCAIACRESGKKRVES